MLSFDDVLSTTKAVRQRLDLDRPLPREVLLECCELANYAPSSRNTQPWSFVFIDEAAKKAKVAQLYAEVWDMLAKPLYNNELANASAADKPGVQRMLKSSQYLRDNLSRVPYILFPVMKGRAEDLQGALPQSLAWGSAVPAIWSFMLAARSRGVGTSWTSLHLIKEQEMAEVIGLDTQQYTQLALIPVAYTMGTDFKKPPRRDLSQAVFFNEMN